MTRPKMIRLRSLRLPIMLAVVLSLPASTTALSIAASDAGSDMELEPARPVDGPATPSVWDPAPTITVRPMPPKPAPPERPLGANPLWAIPLTTLSNTRERPIFSASRRPPAQATVAIARPAAPPPPPAPRAERPPLSLVGTVAGDSESFGIFLDRGTSTALRLRVGEDYQGWRLRNVRGRDVALERDQQTVVLSLPQPGTDGAAAATPMSAMPANSTMEEEQAPTLPRRRR
jgi:hypothetical protein